MRILMLPFLFSLPLACLAQDVERVYYHVDLGEFEAKPSEPVPEHALQSRRIPGAGGVIHKWGRIIQTHENVFRIDGIVCSDNTGMAKPRVSVLIGNLDDSKTLRLPTETDKEGRFSVWIDNRTFAQRVKDAELSEPRIYLVNPTDDGLTQADMYQKRRYLYLGESGVDLYQYRIPYEEAEPAKERNSE